jgi:aminoglycoside 2'-N-acetyltransferase I
MPESLEVVRAHSSALTSEMTRQVRVLCDAAYGEDTAGYFEALGHGEHLLGLREGALVSHLMWVTRWLQVADAPPMRTAYVEMVATAPTEQRRGFATALLERLVPHVADYDVAALCPATDNLYARLGWRFWRGPLAARKDEELLATPDERVMLLELPRTPTLDFDQPLSVEWRPGEVW